MPKFVSKTIPKVGTKVMMYRYTSDYSTIEFTVPGYKKWTEDEFDSAAEFDLRCYVTTPDQYSFDDCWDIKERKTNE
jgi:hypothetical protein